MTFHVARAVLESSQAWAGQIGIEIPVTVCEHLRPCVGGPEVGITVPQLVQKRDCRPALGGVTCPAKNLSVRGFGLPPPCCGLSQFACCAGEMGTAEEVPTGPGELSPCG